jgi:hypothetical protein
MFSDVDRLTAAIGFLSEVRDVDCTLTSLSPDELLRRASSGDEEAFAELTRRRDPEPVAA